MRSSERENAAELLADAIVALDDDREIASLIDLDAIADTVNGPTIQGLLKKICKGGVLGSVLGRPRGADQYDIRVEAFMAAPDASRLYQLADEVARREAHRIAEQGGIGGKIILVP